jgi:hypothetical protein
MKIQEDFIQLAWQTGIFPTSTLTLVDGRMVTLYKKGVLNKDSGPDFNDAKIQIEDTIWAGTIEIHIKSSDWDKHKHPLDPLYNTVILHVVWEYDKPVYNSLGIELPCLELKNIIPIKHLLNYGQLMESLSEIPCENQFRGIDSLTVHHMLERTLVERLEKKSQRIAKQLDTHTGDWKKVFYLTLFRNFGFKTNEWAFEELAQKLPTKLLDLLKGKPVESEALLFGCSGLLSIESNPDPYILQLQNEFAYLQHKYNLSSILLAFWKFSKLRPHNLPYIRIAQLASLLNKHTHLFSKVIDAQDTKELMQLFQTDISPYWIAHYKPGIIGKMTNANLSKEAIDLIIVNTCVPIAFSYGKHTGNEELVQRAIAWLENIQPENNRVVRYWKKIGFNPKNCSQSQSLLELKEAYCNNKNCMQCSIGYAVLKQ